MRNQTTRDTRFTLGLASSDSLQPSNRQNGLLRPVLSAAALTLHVASVQGFGRRSPRHRYYGCGGTTRPGTCHQAPFGAPHEAATLQAAASAFRQPDAG